MTTKLTDVELAQRREEQLGRRRSLFLAGELADSDYQHNKGELPQDFQRRTFRLLDQFRAAFALAAVEQIRSFDEAMESVNRLRAGANSKRHYDLAGLTWVAMLLLAMAGAICSNNAVDGPQWLTGVLFTAAAATFVIGAYECRLAKSMVGLEMIGWKSGQPRLVHCDTLVKSAEWRQLVKVAEVYGLPVHALPTVFKRNSEGRRMPLVCRAVDVVKLQLTGGKADAVDESRAALKRDFGLLRSVGLVSTDLTPEDIFDEATVEVQKAAALLASEANDEPSGAERAMP